MENQGKLPMGRYLALKADPKATDLLIRKVWIRVSMAASERAPMSANLSEAQMKEMQESIKLLVEHPVWNADFGRDDSMRAVKAAMEKNQQAEAAFSSVGLTFEYMIVGREAEAFKSYWLT